MKGRSKKKSLYQRRKYKLKSNAYYIAKYIDDNLQAKIDMQHNFNDLWAFPTLPMKSSQTLRFRRYSEI